MKNTNFCAKANMKRDVNRVEPARRVLLKAGAVLLPSWCFSVLHPESAAAATRFRRICRNLRRRKHRNPFRSRADR